MEGGRSEKRGKGHTERTGEKRETGKAQPALGGQQESEESRKRGERPEKPLNGRSLSLKGVLCTSMEPWADPQGTA